MSSPEELPRPPAARPKYLGPPPPPYPDPALRSAFPVGAGRRWKTSHLLVACVVSFALGVGAALLAGRQEAGPGPSAASSAPGQEVARFSGTGPQATPAFNVDGAWELRWESDSELAISVYRAVDGAATGAPTQWAGRSGSSPQPGPGSYLVEVMGTGTWALTVVQAA